MHSAELLVRRKLVEHALLLMMTRELVHRQMIHLVEGLSVLKPDETFRALNVSLRTWHRIKAKPGARLDKDQSSRVWSLAEVLAKAVEVLGSREDAEQWLAAPAIGLNSRQPIDLMGTPQGAELVKTLLDQMAHGVYA